VTEPATTPTNSNPIPDAFQQRVIDAPERSIRVVAPAGSGKTETLARRVEERIRQGIPPHRILVLTFDRNAAESFRSKLRGASGARPRVETLNAYGYALLRQHIREDRTRVITEPFFPGTRYLSDLVADYGLQVFSSMLSKIKNQVFDPRSVERQELADWVAANKVHLLRDLENEQIVSKVSPRQFGHDLASEYIAYERFLQDRQGIDFDDQKLRPLLHLRKNRDLREQIQGTLDEVIVDEFQDINTLDCELIELISPKATLVVTGDDDQAIYGFRGASAEFLINPDTVFQRKFAHYELSINYRCPARIIDSAGKLILQNETRISKHPRAAKELPGEIETLIAKTPDQEATTIARHAGDMLKSDPPRTIAVLTRTNAQAIDLQAAMIRATTPYEVARENDIRITWELARKMLLLAPTLREQDIPPAEDRVTMMQSFGAARRLPDRQLGALARAATQDDWMFPGPTLLQLMPERLRAFFSSGIAQLKRSRTLRTDIEALEDFLNAIVSRAMEGGRRANQQSRISGMLDLAALYGEKREEFLIELDRLISIQREALRRSSVPKVTLSTCHGAKGREWQVVFVPQCNDGTFPDNRSTEGEYLEAERKLFYVSMTRASEHLAVSWVAPRKDSSTDAKPSRFLIEAGLAKAPRKPATSGKKPGPQTASPSPAPRRSARTSWTPKTASTNAPRTTGRLKRRISLFSVRSRVTIDGLDPAKVASLSGRLVGDEERYDLPLDQMTIRYEARDPDATLPLQLDLALRGVLFKVPDAARFTESPVFQAMQEAWVTRAKPVAGSLDADTIVAMEGVLQRSTSSADRKRWRAVLARLADEEPGTAPDGVQFLPV